MVHHKRFVMIVGLMLLLVLVSALPDLQVQMQAPTTASPTAVIPACASVTEAVANATMDMSSMSGMGAMPVATAVPTADMGSMGAMAMATAVPTADTSSMGAMMMATAAPTMDMSPSIHIVSPKDQDTITGNHIDLVVQVNNVTLGTDNHMHIYLDGKLATMAYTAATTLDNVSAGKHDICVILANESHQNSSIRDGVTVTVSAAQ